MIAIKIKSELNTQANKNRAKKLAGFFKTGKGEYGEGDVFIGVMVPYQRLIASKYKDIKLSNVQKLINSQIHEYRLTALLILTYKYKLADENLKKQIVDFYLKNLRFINNWDLVDLSSPKILGEYYFYNPDKNILYKLARSDNLWERRIAILTTLTFIRNNSFKDTIKISKLLINDNQDLIHKAVGWMLREVGKKNLQTEKSFLLKHYKKMPRTMLRYAIERFDKKTRDFFLKK